MRRCPAASSSSITAPTTARARWSPSDGPTSSSSARRIAGSPRSIGFWNGSRRRSSSSSITTSSSSPTPSGRSCGRSRSTTTSCSPRRCAGPSTAGRTRGCGRGSASRFGLVQGMCRVPGHENLVDRPDLTAAAGPVLAVDRHRFLALGGYDPIYFPGRIEDLDLGFRGWMAGYRGYYVPASVAYHRGFGTFESELGLARSDRLARRNTLLFMWKNTAGARLARHLPMVARPAGRRAARGQFDVAAAMFEAIGRIGPVLDAGVPWPSAAGTGSAARRPSTRDSAGSPARREGGDRRHSFPDAWRRWDGNPADSPGDRRATARAARPDRGRGCAGPDDDRPPRRAGAGAAPRASPSPCTPGPRSTAALAELVGERARSRLVLVAGAPRADAADPPHRSLL